MIFLAGVKNHHAKRNHHSFKVPDFQGNGYIGQYGVIFEEQLLEYPLTGVLWVWLL